uniref:Uncharacterized protein n=1 Tax=candidate division CPR3 bacterium TaxID=2268181 RepID=A0A7C4M3D9_UNCC3
MENAIEKLNTIDNPNIESRLENSSISEVARPNDNRPKPRTELLLPKDSDLEREILELEKKEENTDQKTKIVKEISEILESPNKKTIVKELNRLFKKLQIHQMTDYQNIGAEIMAINN